MTFDWEELNPYSFLNTERALLGVSLVVLPRKISIGSYLIYFESLVQ